MLLIARVPVLFLFSLWMICLNASSTRAGEADGRFDIYFIDVEGGAATLLVTPKGESILIDSGYPDFMNRDRDRILTVLRDVAKLKQIDHAIVTHWHVDHYGNHAALTAEVPVRNFWDRGIPDSLREDKKFEERIAEYRRASLNQSKTLKAGDLFDIPSTQTPLKATILAASREVIKNTGKPNPFAEEHEPKADDTSDNAASISMLFQFGDFKFLTCGDLTWNIEKELVTPLNPIGKVDLFMATHHGLGSSNNPVLVKAIDPVTSVMCNGPSKGGDPKVIATIRSCPSLKGLYQLHRNLKLSDDEQAPADYIANHGTTNDCEGIWIKASVAPDGKSYTIQIGESGTPREYQTRSHGE